MDKLTKAREARIPELVFKCREYIIEKIPLNYRITIKLERKCERYGIERDWYSILEHGLEYAKEVASQAIELHFTHRLQSSLKRKAPGKRKTSNK